MTEWISHTQRRNKTRILKQLLLVFLIITAVSLVIIKFYPERITIHRILGFFSNENDIMAITNIESFYGQIMTDLGLDNNNNRREPLNHNAEKCDYACFSARWPKDYPYAWFLCKVQDACDDYDKLIYDAIEINNGKNLLSVLIDNRSGDTLAEFILVSSSKTLANVSSLSFIFSDFADFKQQEALNLVWLNIPFGFTLLPDQVPDTKLARALNSSMGQCFLQLPVDRQTWETIMTSHKLSGKINNTELNENNLAKVFRIFPVLSAFYFVDSLEVNRKLISLLINTAEKLKLSYIYINESPTYADSLAYLKGLKFKKLDNFIDCRQSTGAEFRRRVLVSTNDFQNTNKGIFYLKSDRENVDIVASLLPLLEKLNIKIVNPQRSLKPVGKL